MHQITNSDYKHVVRDGIFRIYTRPGNPYFADKLETTPIDGLTFLLTSSDGYTTLLSPFSIRSILIDQHKIRLRLTDAKYLKK